MDIIAINKGVLVVVSSQRDTLSGGCEAEGQVPRGEDLGIRRIS